MQQKSNFFEDAKKITTKKKLYRTYNHIPDGDIRVIINEIIANFRKLPIEVARWKKYLRLAEVIEFQKQMDIV